MHQDSVLHVCKRPGELTKLSLLCIPYQGHDSLPLCSQHASLRTHSYLVVLLHFPLHELSRNGVQKIHTKKYLPCFIKLFLSNVLFFLLQRSETYMPNSSPSRLLSSDEEKWMLLMVFKFKAITHIKQNFPWHLPNYFSLDKVHPCFKSFWLYCPSWPLFALNVNQQKGPFQEKMG